MDGIVFKDFISNAALLLSMSIVYELRYVIPPKYGRLTQYITGILISILCIGVMSMPFELTPGLFFDTRTILIGVTAALFGGTSTLIAVFLTSAYRMMLGGVGVWMGVLTIVSSAAIGLAWRRFFLRKRTSRVFSTYILGLAVHLAMLLCTLVLPAPLAMQTLRRIALPVMLIFPVATVLLSMLLIWQKERKEVAQSIAEAEERYRSMFDESNAVMMIIDPDGGWIVDVNPAACRFYGWPKDEMKAMKVSMLSTLPNAQVDENLRQYAERKRQYSLYKQRKANGEMVDVEVRSGPVRIGGRRLLFSIVHDVTDRVAADLKLQESESRLKSAQALASVGNWEIDLATRMFWASEESFTIYGFDYDPDNPYLPMQIVQSMSNPADRQKLDKAMSGLLEKNENYDVEFSIIRKSGGETRYIHSIARMEYDTQGKPKKAVGVVQDITERKRAEMELSNSEAKHREMIANIADVICVTDTGGTIKYISPNNEKWFGFHQDETVGTSGWAFVHPDDLPWLQERFKGLLQGNKNGDTVQCRFRHKNGSYRIVELTALNLAEDPIIGGVLMNYHDVTERNLAQMEYKALLQATTDGFCIVNLQGQLLEMNDAYCKLVGYSRDELRNMTVSDIEADEDSQASAERIKKILATGSDRFETRQRRKDGSIIDAEISCNAVPGNFERIAVFLRDITDRKRREEEVVYLSRHDTLTGLYNRAFFEDALRREDEAGRLPLSVIMGDINGLKLTNDIFGHAEGDKLLRVIASILKSCCRSGDIITRTGGDEFSILLHNTGKDAAQGVCEQIYGACEESLVSTGGKPFHPSISLGCATKTSVGQPIEGILKDAEDSMYKRKLLERKSMHSSLVSSIKATMLEKSHETIEHAERLIEICKAIGRNMNLSSDQLDELELLASLHDIGKIGIDDHILTSPRKLTEQEWQEMRKHPEIGYRIALATPELVPIANYILYHHERWDGTGYPQRLKGEKIPLLARIITVVDSYDAMTSDRPYRKAMPKEEALEEIRRNAGSQFDPEIVKVFLGSIH